MRNNTIDVARGIAFGCMLVHHAFYFSSLAQPDDVGRRPLSPVVQTFGAVARHLFIVLAGFSLAVQFRAQRDDDATKWRRRLWRCAEVGLHALLVSLVTYACYPDSWVRFGILHFLSASLLIASTLMLSAHHETLALCVIVAMLCLPVTNTWLDVASGARPHYSMIDWFPLASWFPWLWLGVLLGKYYAPLPSVPVSNGALAGLSWIGQHSLALYTAHFVVFCAASRYCRP